MYGVQVLSSPNSAVLAIDLGGTHATCALVTPQGVLRRHVLDLPSTDRLAPLLPQFEQVLSTLIGDASPIGLGIGFCGFVGPTGTHVASTNGKYDDALDLDLMQWSAERLGLPLRLENDARLALLGEQVAGAARNETDVVMFTLGTGIGSAVLMGGELLRGKHGTAGNLCGHFPVAVPGRPCNCGGHGCAESEASGWALPRLSREWPNFPASKLAQGELNFSRLFALAAEGDKVSAELLERCLDVWGATAVAAVHAFDPDLLVFGGGIMRSADVILPAIHRRVATAWTCKKPPHVAAAELGADAALYGALTLFPQEPA